jgi:hypothetical protein
MSANALVTGPAELPPAERDSDARPDRGECRSTGEDGASDPAPALAVRLEPLTHHLVATTSRTE